MPDFRAFALPPSAEPVEILLSPEESHHLVSVHRAREGDPVIAFDGRGREWTTELVDAHKHAARLRVRASRQMTPPRCPITLAQALPKGPAMDAIVRKATEIGASRIVPLETARTQVHLDGDRSDRKTDKWRIAALEAAKQCGNPFVPEILPVQSIATLLAAPAVTGELRLIASLQSGAQSLRPVLDAFHARHGGLPAAAVWLVGPEGDFSPEEAAAAERAGFAPVTLGPLVLRSDTAATYALSILSYELQSR